MLQLISHCSEARVNKDKCTYTPVLPTYSFLKVAIKMQPILKLER